MEIIPDIKSSLKSRKPEEIQVTGTSQVRPDGDMITKKKRNFNIRDSDT